MREGDLPMAPAAAPAATPAPADENAFPFVPSRSLDTLWFQVGGTVCNLACTHCFVSCSPTNHTHEMLTLAEVRALPRRGGAARACASTTSPAASRS